MRVGDGKESGQALSLIAIEQAAVSRLELSEAEAEWGRTGPFDDDAIKVSACFLPAHADSGVKFSIPRASCASLLSCVLLRAISGTLDRRFGGHSALSFHNPNTLTDPLVFQLYLQYLANQKPSNNSISEACLAVHAHVPQTV